MALPVLRSTVGLSKSMSVAAVVYAATAFFTGLSTGASAATRVRSDASTVLFRFDTAKTKVSVAFEQSADPTGLLYQSVRPIVDALFFAAEYGVRVGAAHPEIAQPVSKGGLIGVALGVVVVMGLQVRRLYRRHA